MNLRSLTNPFHLSPNTASQEQPSSYNTALRNIPASPASSSAYTDYDSSTSSKTIPCAPPMSFCQCSKRGHEITLRYREMELEKAEFKFKREKAKLELKQYKNELELKLQKEKIDLEAKHKKVQLEAKRREIEHAQMYGVPQSNLSEDWDWSDIGMAVGVVILAVVALAALMLSITASVMVMLIPIGKMGCWILGIC